MGKDRFMLFPDMIRRAAKKLKESWWRDRWYCWMPCWRASRSATWYLPTLRNVPQGLRLKGLPYVTTKSCAINTWSTPRLSLACQLYVSTTQGKASSSRRGWHTRTKASLYTIWSSLFNDRSRVGCTHPEKWCKPSPSKQERIMFDRALCSLTRQAFRSPKRTSGADRPIASQTSSWSDCRASAKSWSDRPLWGKCAQTTQRVWVQSLSLTHILTWERPRVTLCISVTKSMSSKIPHARKQPSGLARRALILAIGYSNHS